MHLSYVFQECHRLGHQFAMVSVTILLTACASFEGLAPSNVAISNIELPSAAGIAQTSDAWPQEKWWTVYGDPQLNRLIDNALSNNPTLAIAQSRIARAQAATALKQSATSLHAGAAVEASYGRISENAQAPKAPFGPGGEKVSQGQASVNFDYDLDLWGKNAALIRAAEAQLKATVYDHQAARLALATAIARTYSQLATQYILQDILQATQKQRRTIRSLTSERVANGLDTNVELKQAETSLAVVRIDLVRLITAINVTRLQLAALAGEMPAAADKIGRPTSSIAPFSVPKNLSLDLLGRRPELAAQRARINAAMGDAQAAKADFYPNINLIGLIGFQAIGLGKLLSAGSLTTSVGPAIHLPIFDGGRLRANYASKNADIDLAIAQYNELVITAVQEVAEKLTRVAALSAEEDATREALAAAKEAHRMALVRYQAGLTPYLTVLAVETQLLTQQRASADLSAKRQDLHIGLLQALGGGFTDIEVSQKKLKDKTTN